MNKLEENIFLQEICQQLDASIAHLDPLIRARLDSSRHTALHGKLLAIDEDGDSLTQRVAEELSDNAGISAEIEAKLDQIRHQAIARLDTGESRTGTSTPFLLGNWFQSQFPAFSLSAPATTLTAVCVLVTAVSLFYVNSRPTGSLPLEEEISLVASADDIELYENLEFYLWLAENESLRL